MVLAGDRSDTYPFGGFVLVQLADSHSFGDDVELIDEPFDPGADVFDCEAAGSFLEGLLELCWPLAEYVEFVVVFVKIGAVPDVSGGVFCNCGGFLHLAVIHGEELYLLHPAAEAIDDLLEVEAFDWQHGVRLLNRFVVDQIEGLD
jgi:hypothetical protein